MNNNIDRYAELNNKLDYLIRRQNEFSTEISNLKREILTLSISDPIQKDTSVNESSLITDEYKEINLTLESSDEYLRIDKETFESNSSKKHNLSSGTKISLNKSNIEKFIGENILNKVGILITVIGVAIGAKYAIDNQLISPLTRIVLGYLIGVGLFLTSIRLKHSYRNFSAVLLSGSIAIMYFITYFAYILYELLPKEIAFILMVLFTLFTIIAAINYNREVIAHIGLVGAYAVPFLLSDNSAKVDILFTYMTIINIGILIISLNKYWKYLYYSSFMMSWLIYIAWYTNSYNSKEHFVLSLIFLAIFYSIFYITFLAYKLYNKEKFEYLDVLLILANSFIIYALGLSIIGDRFGNNSYYGLFTMLNSLIHFSVSLLIYSKKLADKSLFYLIIGLAIVFLTIAIPSQLDGNWVTLLWAGESALLFWIGRTNRISFYEKISYPLMILSFLGIIWDWMFLYSNIPDELSKFKSIMIILNSYFLGGFLYIVSFGFINYVDFKHRLSAGLFKNKSLNDFIRIMIPSIFFIALYGVIRMEISTLFSIVNHEWLATINAINLENVSRSLDFNVLKFKNIWIINYTLIFLSLIGVINHKKINSKSLALITFSLLNLVIIVFLTQNLYYFSELRNIFFSNNLADNYNQGWFNIITRYFSFVILVFSLVISNLLVKYDLFSQVFKIYYEYFNHLVLLIILSSELIYWMEISNSTQAYKLGLSILWGMYSLFLISIGIWKKKKTLRIGAIVLFGITLSKLFFYDVSHLETIYKTVLFVSLGILLLTISFLYNKYKNVISGD